jgi:hypothetical protein
MFVNNTSYGGGAIGIDGGGNVALNGCTFVNNTSGNGGAIQARSCRGLALDRCIFINNTASALSGGALDIMNVVGVVTLDGCTFINNIVAPQRGAAEGGGALLVEGGNIVLIKGCSFIDPISYLHNDVASNSQGPAANVTFSCADGEVGTPVQMQGNEITVIPPKELQCTKPTSPPNPRPSPRPPTPVPLPPSPLIPTPPPSPSSPTPAHPTPAPSPPPPTPEPTTSASHTSRRNIQISSAGGVLILVLSMLCMCAGGDTLRRLNRNLRAKKRRAAALGAIDTSKAVSQEDIMQKMEYDLVVQVAKDGRQEDITFHTWDFGGQQVYYVLHHLFITEGVYCLCFNMLEALNNPSECMEYIAFWLNSTYLHVVSKDGCSILLVGTHRDIVADPQQHRTISDALRNQFERCSFWRCVRQPSRVLLRDSSEDGLCFFPVDNTRILHVGTTSVMDTINLLAEQQVQAREEKPLRWLKVLDELQKIQEGDVNYIELGSRADHASYAFGYTPALKSQDMEDICAPSLWEVAYTNGVTEPADFDALIEFFDSIGIIKRCHSRSLVVKHSQDVIILKPQWLVNVFAAVITCCTLDGPAIEEGVSKEAVAIMLSSDIYRFEAKAILSIRLLRHLWEQKGVIGRFEDMQNGAELEQWGAKFELLLELLLGFDLMFELKDVGAEDGDREDSCFDDEHDTQDSLDGTACDRSDDNRHFLVPAMLLETSVLCTFPQRGGEAPTQPPLHCYFAFKEEGVSLDRGSSGLLPAVVFAKLQAQCASWAQSTSNTEPRLSRRQAQVTFGAQRFEPSVRGQAIRLFAQVNGREGSHQVQQPSGKIFDTRSNGARRVVTPGCLRDCQFRGVCACHLGGLSRTVELREACAHFMVCLLASSIDGPPRIRRAL